MLESLIITFNISPIKTPSFKFWDLIQFLWTPITFIEFILSFNNNIGYPKYPLSVDILNSNSLLFIFIILPVEHNVSFSKGFFIEKIFLPL